MTDAPAFLDDLDYYDTLDLPRQTVVLFDAYLYVDSYQDPGKRMRLDGHRSSLGRDVGKPLYIELHICDSLVTEFGQIEAQLKKSRRVRLRAEGRDLFDLFESVRPGWREISQVVLESIASDPETPDDLSVSGFRKARLDDLPTLAKQYEILFHSKHPSLH